MLAFLALVLGWVLPGCSGGGTEASGGAGEEDPPVAGFSGTPTSGAAPLSVAFADESTGVITSWSWEFGGSGSSTAQNPVHTFAAAGIYDVSLTVSGPGGFDTLVRSGYITVNDSGGITAEFSGTPTAGSAPLSVQFTDESVGDVTSWDWDFGDSGGATAPDPSHTYTEPGSYTVSLTVSGPGGSSTRVRLGYITVDDGGGTGFDDYAMQFGMNPSDHNWTSREIVFADVMARGMEFEIIRNDGMTSEVAPLIPLGEDPPLLGEGWPDFAALGAGEKAGSRLMNDMEGSIPDGRTVPYVLTWEGTGSCSLRGQVVAGEQGRSAQRAEVFVDPTAAGGNGLLVMYIDSSSPADPVRNVHVWLPGMEAAKPLFWAPYLAKVEAMNHGNGPYSWRVLNWNRVNMYGRLDGNLLFTFDLAGRIRPSSPSQGTRRGMCPEFVVAFANATRTNLHFPVPHRTDDMSEADYVVFLTDTLARIRDGSAAVPGINGGQPFAGLDPNLTLTLEVSNEIWNNGFPVYGWMQREAARKGFSFHAQIASQVELVFGVADTVFSGVDAPRLRKFIGAFVADPSFVVQIASFLPPGFEVNAIGPAAYFSPRNSVIDDWMEGADPDTGECPNCPTVEEVIAASRDRIPDLRALVQVHRNIADNYTNPDSSHPRLELYEGGQGIVAGFQPWVDAANAAQVHPLMYDAYVLDMIPMLVEEGVDVMNWLAFMTDQDPIGGGGYGPFGIWNDMNQTITLPVPDVYVDEGAPKAAAIYKGPPLLQ
ncbi:MAG: PKD domain-containing protein [Planctomycetota bacterium]